MAAYPAYNTDMLRLVHYTKSEIEGLEKIYRTNLVNSLSGFKSLNLCATISGEGKTNVAILNSVVHIGAQPALMGMILRPATVPRHTLANILSGSQYTINHVNEEIYQKAHQTSARYSDNISEFKAAGLNEQYTGLLKAPYVLEARIKIGLELKEKIDIKSNNTILIIGAILEVILPADILGVDGFVDIEKGGTMAGTGLDAYYKAQQVSRLPYAKP